jgi:putative FmdB family regulatory protein
MPLYEYQCQACSKEIEVLVMGQQEPECPLCGSRKLKKMLSIVAAPNTRNATSELPRMPAGGCGRPQCGTHGCQGLE